MLDVSGIIGDALWATGRFLLTARRECMQELSADEVGLSASGPADEIPWRERHAA